MSTLNIRDLSRSEILDRQSLSAVRGGMMKGAAPAWFGHYDLSSHDSSLKVDQFIGQNQVVNNANGNNAAFVFGIESTVKPRQEAENNVVRL